MTRRGFTIAETLLVLLIFSFFSLLPAFALQRWQQMMAVDQFFSRLEKSILVTQQVAITDKIQTQFALTWDNTAIFFRTSKLPESQLPQLTIPNGITVDIFTPMAFSARKGNNSEMRTITFRWPKQQQTIQYKFQFGSGHYQKIVK